MFDTSWIADLDAESACRAIADTQVDLREAEWRELALAAHWADLHDEDTLPVGDRPVLAGMERATPVGGEGTPAVAEFACAELGVLMRVGPVSAENLLRDALDLRHRHPGLWALLGEGRARVWKARKVAHATSAAGLSLEQARAVDAAVAPYVDSLPWKPFADLVAAKVVEADPVAAEARRVAESLARFVATGQSDEFGLKTLIVKANAGDVIFFVAMCDRIAACLAEDGDTDPVDVRRSKAVGILAQPALAYQLLERHAAVAPVDPDEPVPDGPDEPGCDCGAPASGPRPAVDPDLLRPAATLYVRISEESLRSGTGVAVCGGPGGAGSVGVVTVQQVADLLGHCRVTVRQVVDLRDQLPVDAYEVPARMREALKLSRPSSVFPYSSTTSEPDLDHTIAYLPPERGGPPGQTRIGNLGPLHRFGHRVKTHGRGWRHHQPVPGVYLWRTPHGYWTRVDQHGTHVLEPSHALTAVETSPSELERAFALLVLAA
jgi:hypothetical protein